MKRALRLVKCLDRYFPGIWGLARRRMAGLPLRWLARASVWLLYDPATQVLPVLRGPLAGMWLCVGDLDNRLSGSRPLDWALGAADYEPEVREALGQYCRPGGVVFDVGANLGLHTLYLSRQVGAGQVYAFEPNPLTAAILRRSLAANGLDNVVLVEAAVADHNGHAEFIYSGPQDAEACLVAEGEYYYQGGRPALSRIALPVIAMDDFIGAGQIERVALIKLDVQGAELHALRGLVQTLRRQRPVVLCEMCGADNLREGAALLESLGYACRILQTTPFPAGSRALRGAADQAAPDFYTDVVAVPLA